jgi:hypothetical protein
MIETNDEMKWTPDDEPPEGAAHFVVYHKTIVGGESGDGTGLAANNATRYEPGDELPHDLARRIWSAFGDRIAAFGPHGDRLDTPTRGDVGKDTGALDEWRQARVDGDPPYPCAACDETFVSPTALAGHQAVHAAADSDASAGGGGGADAAASSEDDSAADDGSAAPADPADPADGPPFSCGECGKEFDTPPAYYGHQAVHAKAGGGGDDDAAGGANATGEAATAVTDGGPSNGGEGA